MNYLLTLTILLSFPVAQRMHSGANWGFYGHRLINRMAVFTLPSDMIAPYKANIDFLTDHAVDPDKRRYATRNEAPRHFIDLDQWGDGLPRRWLDVLSEWVELYCVTEGDTVWLHRPLKQIVAENQIPDDLKLFVARQVIPQYDETVWTFDPDTVQKYLPELDCKTCNVIYGDQHFSEHGILPYYLYTMQRRLTAAFARQDLSSVLRVSADLGHYVADAHVPLHTTKNYNGQLTGQDGIHAFWESRIPELFAEKEWDFLVGQAEYIEDPMDYYWKIVLKSHQLVGEVLSSEKALSEQHPEDRQYCFDERSEAVVRTQCPEYAKAYDERMHGMVESRMRDAILAVGSAWFTAWVDGGQPAFEDFTNTVSDSDRRTYEELERAYIRGKEFGRKHE